MPSELKQITNPPNPYSRFSLEWLDVPPQPNLQVYEEKVASIINKNDSPDIGFDYSINPYRGCFHACSYCYARPTHNYLDFGAGSDFESKLIVKINAKEKLIEEFNKRSWKGECIVFSGVTDCYQPLEASYELTRACLEVCASYRNPVGIITKGALIRRDIDVLSRLNEHNAAQVFLSIAFSDDSMSKKVEPGAPRPSTRFRAMRELHAAGIPVGVALAPVIPGLNDSQIPSILEEAKACGATRAFMTLLRLPLSVKDVFLKNIEENFPTRLSKVVNQLKDQREGKFNSSTFGQRMKGNGERWEAINWLFKSNCEKLELNKREQVSRETPFMRPTDQLSLF